MFRGTVELVWNRLVETVSNIAYLNDFEVCLSLKSGTEFFLFLLSRKNLLMDFEEFLVIFFARVIFIARMNDVDFWFLEAVVG